MTRPFSLDRVWRCRRCLISQIVELPSCWITIALSVQSGDVTGGGRCPRCSHHTYDLFAEAHDLDVIALGIEPTNCPDFARCCRCRAVWFPWGECEECCIAQGGVR